jgi:hypothetical protein
VSVPLLLDEMFSDAIAQQLRAEGHDVQAVVADSSLASLPDDQILARAAATGRALVTANIKDFMPLDARYRSAGQAHAGLILISAKTFPQNRSYMAPVTSALANILDRPGQIQAGQVTFLSRHWPKPGPQRSTALGNPATAACRNRRSLKQDS